MVLSKLSNPVPDASRSRNPGPVACGCLTAPIAAVDEARRRIAQTVGYMQESLNQSVQVPQLARVANISPSHFFAVFKKQTGFAPLGFFIRLRMQRACEIFDSTVFSVKEVAGALGYDDPFYFSRVFKSMSGFAPTEYRRLPEAQKQMCRQRLWDCVDAETPDARATIPDQEAK